MADGYSRVTGKHGVCIAQNGPGITNFVTGIAAAYWAHSPVVCIMPESGSLTMGLGGFQETEQMPIFSKITKYQVHINSPLRMAELLHRAFTIAMNERGPVQVNIPRDYYYGEGDYEIQAPQKIERGPSPPFQIQRENGAWVAALAVTDPLLLGVREQVRIISPLHLGVRRQLRNDSRGVFTLTRHAELDCRQAAVQDPTLVRLEDVSEDRPHAAKACDERRVLAHHDAGQDVALPGQVFRRRVDAEISAEWQRVLEDGPQERVVDGDEGPSALASCR
jgi:hypothetical protein